MRISKIPLLEVWCCPMSVCSMRVLLDAVMFVPDSQNSGTDTNLVEQTRTSRTDSGSILNNRVGSTGSRVQVNRTGLCFQNLDTHNPHTKNSLSGQKSVFKIWTRAVVLILCCNLCRDFEFRGVSCPIVVDTNFVVHPGQYWLESDQHEKNEKNAKIQNKSLLNISGRRGFNFCQFESKF